MSRSPNDDIGMKSVNAFFTPAAKKVKYHCEGETYQISGKEQVGELNMKRNNTREGQSTSSQVTQGLWFVLKICDVGFIHCFITLQASFFGMIRVLI